LRRENDGGCHQSNDQSPRGARPFAVSRAAARAADKHADKRNAQSIRDEREAMRRWQCTMFRFWRDCARSGCRRMRACSGDPDACFERRWPLLPEECRVWFRTAITALSAGASPQAADTAGCEAALNHGAQAAEPPPSPAMPNAPSPAAPSRATPPTRETLPDASTTPRLRAL
jgi:hypothetical protein